MLLEDEIIEEFRDRFIWSGSDDLGGQGKEAIDFLRSTLSRYKEEVEAKFKSDMLEKLNVDSWRSFSDRVYELLGVKTDTNTDTPSPSKDKI